MLSLVLGLSSALAVFWATAGGPIVLPDSMSYLGAAQSLAEHGELQIPMADWNDDDSTTVLQQFPPAYPTAVAVAILAGAPGPVAPRLVNALAVLVTVASLTWIVARSCGDVAGALVPVLLVSVRGVPAAHLTALSEPLFFAALAATITLMAAAPSRPAAYGATAALGNMVRYAGVSLIVAAVVWAFVWAAAPRRAAAGRSRRTRLGHGARAALLGALPGTVGNAAWLLRARHGEFDTPATTLAWTGHLGATLAEAGRMLAEHLAPVPLPWPARVVVAWLVAAGAIGLLVWGARASRGVEHAMARRVGGVSGLVAGCYAAVLVYSRLFVGESIPFDDRMLAPFFVSATLVLAVAASLAWRSAPHWAGANVRRVAAVLAALWLTASVAQSLQAATRTMVQRSDYRSARSQRTPAAVWLRGEGRHYPLFSNNPPVIYFVTGRPSRTLPETSDPDSIRAFGETLRRSGGVLVEYPAPFFPMAHPGRLAAALGLCAVVRASSGTVWMVPDTSRDAVRGGGRRYYQRCSQ